jgi:hypothetical protein
LVAAPGAIAATVVPFAYTGAEQPFPVPANVSSIHVVAVGAPGGASSATSGFGAGPGGFGATATADLTVAPGETLYVEVGGAGMIPGGAAFNGGGLGGPFPHPGGGGGGASDVRTVSMSAGLAATLASRVVVAGGGGGGGSQTAAVGGAGGGATGGTGLQNSGGISGGVGGSQSAGGGVGNCGGSTAPTAGTAGIGGDGGTSPDGGGGGGGGYYGGGGGGEFCGGGGGSGYFGAGTSNTSFTADTSGTPAITLSYTVNPAVAVTAPANGASYTQNQVVDAAYTCTAASGTTLSSCAGPVVSGVAIDTATTGAHTFSVAAADADGGTTTTTVTYTVTASNGGGGGGGGGAGAPTITGLGVKPARWRDHGRPHLAHKPPLGTTLTFTLSAAANVTLTFTRTAPGRKAGHRCLAPTRHNRHSHACTRKLAAGKLTLSVSGGANTISFNGKLSGHKPLAPGHYTVVITASNTGGSGAPSKPLAFTIVKP